MYLSFISIIYSSALPMRIVVFFALVVSLLISCKPKKESEGIVAEPAFYHWKSVFAPTTSELNLLNRLKVETIYLRFFDVEWNEITRQPSPIAQLRMPDKTVIKKERLKIIPTVFITNECIQKMSMAQCGSLAKNIVSLIKNMMDVNNVEAVKEIQIDCDWTASTKERYFALLQALQMEDSLHLFSATVRLFQVKYEKQTGVPPVKKGLLMCYNMGNLKDPTIKNSILDVTEFKKYSGNLGSYPLPLDIALPLFDWYVLFRQGSYAGLIRNMDEQTLKDIAVPKSEHLYAIKRDTLLSGYDLKKGDVIRYEKSDYKEIMKTAALIKDKMTSQHLRISLYHLDSLLLKKYTPDEIENIFNSLR